MIKIVWSINDINKYQTGSLPEGAVKIETPQSVGELMKKAVPIAAILCVFLFIAMLGKTIICKTVVISPIFIPVGFAFGFLLLIMHEWLHGIVYPKEADVTIGRIKGKTTFVALASYPLKRNRFILMCLLPFVLGLVPFILFVIILNYDVPGDAVYEIEKSFEGIVIFANHEKCYDPENDHKYIDAEDFISQELCTLPEEFFVAMDIAPTMLEQYMIK